VGRTYDVKHDRKGSFRVLVTAINGEWIDALVVHGRANAMLAYNVAEEGDPITMRASMCRFKECSP